MRFSIRDLLWATLVVAMGLGWWVDRRAIDDLRAKREADAAQLRARIEYARSLVVSCPK